MLANNVVNLVVIAREVSLHEELGPVHARVLPAAVITRVEHGVVGNVGLEEDAVERGLVHLMPELGVGGLEDVLAERGVAGRPDLTAEEDEAAHAGVEAAAGGSGRDLHEGLKARPHS